MTAYKTSSLTEFSDIQAEMEELKAESALEDRVERTSVRSPVDGVINRIHYMTTDAYINTGDVLLKLFQQDLSSLLKQKLILRILQIL